MYLLIGGPLSEWNSMSLTISSCRSNTLFQSNTVVRSDCPIQVEIKCWIINTCSNIKTNISRNIIQCVGVNCHYLVQYYTPISIINTKTNTHSYSISTVYTDCCNCIWWYWYSSETGDPINYFSWIRHNNTKSNLKHVYMVE